MRKNNSSLQCFVIFLSFSLFLISHSLKHAKIIRKIQNIHFFYWFKPIYFMQFAVGDPVEALPKIHIGVDLRWRPADLAPGGTNDNADEYTLENCKGSTEYFWSDPTKQKLHTLTTSLYWIHFQNVMLIQFSFTQCRKYFNHWSSVRDFKCLS